MDVQISFGGELFSIKRSDVYYDLLTAMSSILHEVIVIIYNNYLCYDYTSTFKGFYFYKI